MSSKRPSPGNRPIDVLLVEDNPGDVRLTAEALRESGADVCLHVVDDGEKALEFLRRLGAYRDAPRPQVVLLDLNLPRMHGRAVLDSVKTDPLLRRIPVIVVTGERSREQVLASYEHHANAFVSKPTDSTEFMSMVKTFEEFWLNSAVLPGE
jgi:CheY-like chemotaxis protein